MDQRSADFAAQLMETFKIEADEHLKSLSDGLLALEKELPLEERQEVLETVFREAHSLKGASRAVDLVKIQDICQTLENVLSGLKHGKVQLTPELFNTLYSTIDLIGNCIKNPEFDDRDLMRMLAQKLGEDRQQENIELPQSSLPQEPKQTPETHENPSIKTIRVSINKLDGLMQEVEEMLMVKTIIGQRQQTLKDLLRLTSQWEKEWGRVRKDLRMLRQAKESGQGIILSKEILEFFEQQPAKIKELKESIQQSVSLASQDQRLAGSMVDGLLEDTKKVLMQPFSSLFEVFPRMVRDIAQSLQKKITLTMNGGEIEVDRRILEEMKDPLIHLIRNSIDHGIEAVEERTKKRKSSQGVIHLSATQKSGNRVEITLSDDGKGINVDDVKNSAVKSGLIAEKESRDLGQEEALKLIFKSGLSTSPIITELSGRGLGLGIVLEKVEKLGGHLHVESTPNLGTSFKITLPLTLATFRGVHVIAADNDFIFPTHNLVRVLRITGEEIQTTEGKETLNLNGRILSYVHLSTLLNLKSSELKSTAEYMHVLIIKAMDTTVAIGVDKMLNEQQVFVKGLGMQLARVKNIAAATVMEWGKVIPILDPFDLIKSVGNVHAKVNLQHNMEDNANKKRKILIAEDSVTARVLLKNILESAGFEVKAAVDGAEALSFIKVEDFDLLLSDIEMPRLDGFKLTEKVRSIEKYKDLPIVLCTSLGSREDREHGVEVGANAYIDKSSFTQSYLLEIIQKFF